MNNANQPAAPLSVTDYQLEILTGKNKTVDIAGLTKREYFAGLAMQGLLASDTCGNMAENRCSELAVSHADSLLAELERTK